MELLQVLALLLLLVAITVVPVMLAAKWARAQRSGFFACLAAVVIATVAGQLALHLLGGALLGLLAAFVAGCAAYALVLGTSFVAAVGIAVVAIVLQAVIVTALLLLGLQVPSMTAGGLTL